MRGQPTGFYYKLGGTTAGADGLQDLVLVGLATTSDQGDLRPVLAEAVPSLENGNWKLSPDGGMETTWTIRPNARWHDGAPFTAQDLAFTVQLATDRDLPLRDSIMPFLERGEARDEHTFVAHWKRTFIWADRLFSTAGSGVTSGQILPLPRHLLEGPYTENKETFLGLPYWSDEFVGTGPFVVRELDPDSHAVVAANDQFALGRPKIDEIEVKFIPDSNTLVANVLAGVVDLTLSRTVSLEQGADAARRAPVRMEATPFNLQRLYPQFIDPQPAVTGDVRFRQAALLAIDRQELIDTLENGLTQVPDSILPPGDTLHREAEVGVAQYPYDPARAAQLLADLGYTRAADGALRSASGERLGSVEIQSQPGDDNQAKVLLAIADYWQRVGVSVDPVTQPPRQDAAISATRRGFWFRGGPNALLVLPTFVSTEIPRQENGYTGANVARYASSEYDALFTRFFSAIPDPERMRSLNLLLRHVTENLPLIPLYYRVEARIISNRLIHVAPRALESGPAWDAHRWEVQDQ
ncbi:MAG TPA: ABC transporter substrate-binding protein [Chloroflexota bacterium]|nr:ABC transporter substrate-binding protein [Chloroflexota bacterium]